PPRPASPAPQRPPAANRTAPRGPNVPRNPKAPKPPSVAQRLQAQIQKLAEHLSALQKRVSKIEHHSGRVGSMGSGDAAQLTTAVERADERIEALEGSAVDRAGRIDAIEQAVQQVDSAVARLEGATAGRVLRIRSDAEETRALVGDLSPAVIETLGGRVASLEERLGHLVEGTLVGRLEVPEAQSGVDKGGSSDALQRLSELESAFADFALREAALEEAGEAEEHEARKREVEPPEATPDPVLEARLRALEAAVDRVAGIDEQRQEAEAHHRMVAERLSALEARAEQRSSQRTAPDFEVRIAKLEAEWAGSSAERRPTEGRVEGLANPTGERESSLERALARVARIENELTALREEQKALATLHASARASAQRSSPERRAKRSSPKGSKRGSTKAAHPLRQLKGIGPKYEKLLHDQGVRELSQIAAWTREDIDRIAPLLGMKAERIRGADWVKAAQALMAARTEASDGSDVAG
ncbi:MAG: hypothetical protein AAGF12_43915, partial [Myxococcota bacterium]